MQVNKQSVFAVLIISMTLSTVAYAGILSFGAAVNIDAVSISVSYPSIPNIPRWSIWATEETNGLNMSGFNSLNSGDQITIRVELIVDKNLADAVRNIVVIIDSDDDGSYESTDIILTLNSPAGEFTYTVPNPVPNSEGFSYYVMIFTGWQSVTGGRFIIKASVVGFTPA